MTNDFEKVFDAAAETQDYTGGDGLLYCGSCRTPKQFRMDKPPMEGRLLPRRCQCEQAQYDKEEAERKRRKHLQAVEELKRRGFTDSKMREWTFANDNGKCPQMELAHFYAEHWETMREENIGYLLWGKVGTEKLFCRVHRQCPHGAGSPRPHDQLRPYSAELDKALAEYAELKAQASDFDSVELYQARQVLRPAQEKAAERQLEETLQKKPSFSLLLSAKQEVSRLLGEDTEERQARQMVIRRQRSDPQKPKHFQR